MFSVVIVKWRKEGRGDEGGKGREGRKREGKRKGKEKGKEEGEREPDNSLRGTFCPNVIILSLYNSCYVFPVSDTMAKKLFLIDHPPSIFWISETKSKNQAVYFLIDAVDFLKRRFCFFAHSGNQREVKILEENRAVCLTVVRMSSLSTYSWHGLQWHSYKQEGEMHLMPVQSC